MTRAIIYAFCILFLGWAALAGLVLLAAPDWPRGVKIILVGALPIIAASMTLARMQPDN